MRSVRIMMGVLIGVTLTLILGILLIPREKAMRSQSPKLISRGRGSVRTPHPPTTAKLPSAKIAPSKARDPSRDFRRYPYLRELLQPIAVKTNLIIHVPVDFQTIQEALDSAEPGSVVLVAPGEYSEDLTLRKGVTLAAAQPDTVTLRGNVVFADDTTLLNLTFVAAQVGSQAAQDSDSKRLGEPQPHRSKVKGMWEANAAIPVQGVRILHCRFSGAHVSGSNCLLRMRDVEQLTIAGCVFSFAGKWSEGDLYGLNLLNCSNILVHGNVIADLCETEEGRVAGLVVYRCSGTIAGNIIADINGNMQGSSDDSESKWPGRPTWNDGTTYGILAWPSHDLVVRHNTVSNICNEEHDCTIGIEVLGDDSAQLLGNRLANMEGEDDRAQVLGNVVANIKGAERTAAVYGIDSRPPAPTIVGNNVSGLSIDYGYGHDGNPVQACVTIGGVRNGTKVVSFLEGTYHLSGPPELLQDGRDRIGAFAEEPLTVEIPDCVQIPEAAEGKNDHFPTSPSLPPDTASKSSPVTRPPEMARNPNREFRHYAGLTELLQPVPVETNRVIYVPGDFQTIQQALDAAEPGSMILLAPGEYFGGIRLSKGVTLAARQPDTVTLSGDVIFADDTTLLNLTFVGTQIGRQHARSWNAQDRRGASDAIPLHRVRILFCRFSGVHTGGDNYLLRMQSVEDLTIAGCVFSFAGQWGRGDLYGLHLLDCSRILVYGNVIADLHEAEWGDLAGLAADRCSGKIAANVIADINETHWGSGYGIVMRQPRDLVVRHNTVSNIIGNDWDSACGIAVTGEGRAQVLGNVVADVQGGYITSSIHGISSENTSSTIVDNNVGGLYITDNLPTSGATIRPYLNIDGAENWRISVWLREGTYHLEGAHQLSGPPEFLEDGRESIGVYAEDPLTVKVPDCVQVPKTVVGKNTDLTPTP